MTNVLNDTILAPKRGASGSPTELVSWSSPAPGLWVAESLNTYLGMVDRNHDGFVATSHDGRDLGVYSTRAAAQRALASDWLEWPLSLASTRRAGTVMAKRMTMRYDGTLFELGGNTALLDAMDLSAQGVITLDLADGGKARFVTGPGIPIVLIETDSPSSEQRGTDAEVTVR
jgi:hypothetical protein